MSSYCRKRAKMTDYGENDKKLSSIKPIDKARKSVAVAVQDGTVDSPIPKIKAAARGALAEKIAQIAFDNDIKVREDADLANMLAEIELDSPIPTEAMMAVAEILSYVYRANGEPDPFNALIEDLNQDKT
jgi:flagellar biosynthesis protein